MDKKLKNLAPFKKDPQLAIYHQLSQLNDKLDEIKPLLEDIKSKEYPTIPPFPDFPEQIPYPEQPDLSKVETLLQKLIDKKPDDVVVKLDIQ